MRNLIRLAFVVLILLGLAGQLQALRPRDAGADDVGALVGKLAGLGLRGAGPNADGVITATAPDCAFPVQVALLYSAGGEEARAAALVGPGMMPRFVYLGLVTQQADRWRIHLRYMEGTVAGLVGLRPRGVPSHMVVAALPDACPNLAERDWAALSPWN